MKARPLRVQIVIISAALFLVVLAALLVSSQVTYREQVAGLRDEARAMTSIVVAYLERHLRATDDVAALAVRHPDVQRLDAAAALAVLRMVADGEPSIRNAVLADADGRILGWAMTPLPGLEEQLDPAWLAEVARTGERRVTQVLSEPRHAVHVVVMGYPIAGADGGVAGVIGLAVHLEALEQVFSRIPLPAGSVITVTDEQSVVVARSLDAARYVGRPVESSEASLRPLDDIPAVDLRVGLDDVERVYGNALVPRGPWLASVGIPTAVARARVAPIDRRNYVIMVGAIAIVLGLALYFVRRWLAALDEVARAAARVAAGDLSPLAARDLGSLELNQLHVGVAGMIDNLRTAQQAVAAQVQEERRIREEKESLQQQLIRQERLAAIGVLVSGVAHELNNPLQAILGFAELLQMHDDLPDGVRRDLELIRRESTRASGIIRNLQRFGRQTSEPSPVRLSDVVASVLELRQRKIDEQGIRLDIEDQSEAYVSSVFTELQQVVLNFVINAEQAVRELPPERRRVLIRTSDGRNTARLEVEDHGDGVPPADEPKLFQPFFTTKPVGEGTGLGLSVSYGIITSHGGEIGYRRAHHGGAIFYFELPTQ